MDEMYHAVQKANQHLWPALLHPGNDLTARPEYSSHGSVEEMQLTLQYCFDSWSESPKALEVIRGKLV